MFLPTLMCLLPRPNNMRLMKPTGNGLYALVNKALTPKANSSSSSLLEHWHLFLSILYPSQTPAHQIQLTLVNQSVSARVMAEGEGKVSVSKVGRCRGRQSWIPQPSNISRLNRMWDLCDRLPDYITYPGLVDLNKAMASVSCDPEEATDISLPASRMSNETCLH